MKTIEEIRHLNLLRVLAGYPTLKAFADVIGKDPAQVGQWKNQHPRITGKVYRLDSNSARLIEDKLDLPLGWMDADPDAWPFDRVDLDKVQSLDRDDRLRLEGALLVLAHQIGLDVGNAAAA